MTNNWKNQIIKPSLIKRLLNLLKSYLMSRHLALILRSHGKQHKYKNLSFKMEKI